MKESEIISVQNQKGGVGKSTFAHALAYRYAQLGCKTLLVDFDPQATLTGAFIGFKFGAFTKEDESNISNIFYGKDCKPVNISTIEHVDNPKMTTFGETRYVEKELMIDFCPSNEELLHVTENDDLTKSQKIESIYQFLISLKSKYEKIIIDCPPSFGIITTAVVKASDSALITIPTKNVDMDGMLGYFNKLNDALQSFDENHLQKILILPNMYDVRFRDSKLTLNSIKKTPLILKQMNYLRAINCEVLDPFPYRSIVQEAPSANSFLVPFIMDYARKNKDLILLLEDIATKVSIFPCKS